MRSLGFDSESALSVNIGTERFPRRREERSGPGGPRAPVQRAAPPRAAGWGWGFSGSWGCFLDGPGGPARSTEVPPKQFLHLGKMWLRVISAPGDMSHQGQSSSKEGTLAPVPPWGAEVCLPHALCQEE